VRERERRDMCERGEGELGERIAHLRVWACSDNCKLGVEPIKRKTFLLQTRFYFTKH